MRRGGKLVCTAYHEQVVTELRARAEKAEADLKSAAEAFGELGSGYILRAEKAEAELARLREGIETFVKYASKSYFAWVGERACSQAERDGARAEWDQRIAALLEVRP